VHLLTAAIADIRESAYVGRAGMADRLTRYEPSILTPPCGSRWRGRADEIAPGAGYL